MKRIAFSFTVACALFFCGSAFAATSETIQYQGTLFDSELQPLDGSHIIKFRIFDSESEGAPGEALWSEPLSADVVGGVFSLPLGASTAFPVGLFDNADLWLELEVCDDIGENCETMAPRQAIRSVPWAQKAFSVEGEVKATSVYVGGSEVIDSSGAWLGESAGLEGADGIHCWDLNGNGECDTGAEDTDTSGGCDVDDCKGPKGDTGDTGPKGDTGEKGDTGDTGLKGDTGDTGLKGDPGDTGLKGDPGDTGPKGDTGDAGPKGDPGDAGADGYNCWDLNENGFCDLESEDFDDSSTCTVADCQNTGTSGLALDLECSGCVESGELAESYYTEDEIDASWYNSSEVDGLFTGLNDGDPATLPFGWADMAGWENVVVVAKSGGDYSDIPAAINSITDASEAKPYLVYIAAGMWELNSQTIWTKENVHLQGAGIDATVIVGKTAGYNTLKLNSDNTSIRDMTLDNEHTFALLQADAPDAEWKNIVISNVKFHSAATAVQLGAYNKGAIIEDVQVYSDSGGGIAMYTTDLILRRAIISVATTGISVLQYSSMRAENIIIQDASVGVHLDNLDSEASIIGGRINASYIGVEVLGKMFELITGEITVTAAGEDTYGLKFTNAAGSAVLDGVRIKMDGNINTTGVFNAGTADLRGVSIDVSGGDNGYGILNYSNFQGQDLKVSVTDNNVLSTGLWNISSDSNAILTSSRFAATGDGSANTALLTAANSTIDAFGVSLSAEGSATQYSARAEGSSAIKLSNCSLKGDLSESGGTITTRMCSSEGGGDEFNYYSVADLDGGAMDGRYYTENELTTGGVLNDYYYTEGEIDASWYNASELDGGSLDGRYYTEDEIDASWYTSSEVNGLFTDLNDGNPATGAVSWADLSKWTNTIVVAASGGDYSSIQAAIDSISDATASNPYMVYVAPGLYDLGGAGITLKEHVHLVGASRESVIVDSGQFAGGTTVSTDSNSSVTDMTIRNGTTSGDAFGVGTVGKANVVLRNLKVEVLYSSGYSVSVGINAGEVDIIDCDIYGVQQPLRIENGADVRVRGGRIKYENAAPEAGANYLEMFNTGTKADFRDVVIKGGGGKGRVRTGDGGPYTFTNVSFTGGDSCLSGDNTTLIDCTCDVSGSDSVEQRGYQSSDGGSLKIIGGSITVDASDALCGTAAGIDDYSSSSANFIVKGTDIKVSGSGCGYTLGLRLQHGTSSAVLDGVRIEAHGGETTVYGVKSYGVLNISHSVILASGGEYARAVQLDGGEAQISDSRLNSSLGSTDNYSILNNGATVTVSGGRIVGESAAGTSGGGVVNKNTLTISNATVEGTGAGYTYGLRSMTGAVSTVASLCRISAEDHSVHHQAGSMEIVQSDLSGTVYGDPTLKLCTIDGDNTPSTAELLARLEALENNYCPPGYEKVTDASIEATGYYCKRGSDEIVKVGDFWIDRYEATIWQNADCTGTRYGSDSDNWASEGATGAAAAENDIGFFPRNGNWTTKLYSCSVEGVKPSRWHTWFQAEQACLASGKYLCTNAEWQAAASGTDISECNTGGSGEDGYNGSDPEETGNINNVSYDGCISNYGTFDQVGNVCEWTAMWTQAGPDNDHGNGYEPDPGPWPDGYGSDHTWNITGASSNGAGWVDGAPASALRGGYWDDGSKAGVFALHLTAGPATWSYDVGARCCRR